MSIKTSRILMILLPGGLGSIIGLASKYLIFKQDPNANLSKEQLFIKIKNLFTDIAQLIYESKINQIILEFKYNLPGENHKIHKDGSLLFVELTNWFTYWIMENDIYFSTNIKENKNSSSYEIFYQYNEKKYKFLILLSNKNKAHYETTMLFLLKTIEPLIKQLNELIFIYHYK